MPSVRNLKNRFETIAQQHSPNSTQRVHVKRYSMALRQSTLSFGAVPTGKRHSMSAAQPRRSIETTTPPADDSEGDTIVVNRDPLPKRVSLPTPSESATDASSETSSTRNVRSPPRSRSKRVSAVRKSASKDSLTVMNDDKQRNISGETLVPSAANASQTTFVKKSVEILNMEWNMSVDFQDQKSAREDDAQTDTSSTVVVAAPAEKNMEETQLEKKPSKRVKIAAEESKWEKRRKDAEKNATRKSSRASTLLSKATEVVSNITSSMLGKRDRTDTAAPEEPDSKKARLADDLSLTTTNKAMKTRTAKNKKWLISGLYAGQSRSFDPTLSEAKNKRKSGIQAPDPSPSGSVQKENSVLPLPMFAGERLLQTGRDFKLPFDVFSPLPQQLQGRPDEWRKVNKNVFVGDAADHWRFNAYSEHSTCVCTPVTGCDENCMNRFMYYECDSRNCNLSEDQCGNRAFEQLRKRVKKGGKYNVGVDVLKTKDRGNGVRANRTFEPGQIIVEYTGEIITQEECESRMRGVYKDNECYYLMAFDQNMIIDATRGSIARFVNHSCDPNCRMEKWTVSGKPRMALFAGDKGIVTGEELTYDYNFDPYSQKNVQKCHCGSDNCRGFLGPRPKDAESKLAGAKRKLAEVLEESKETLLNKKRKVEKEMPKLPKGWAYIEPDTKSKQRKKEKAEEKNDSEDGQLSRQPSKLKKAIIQKSSLNGKSKGAAPRKSASQKLLSSASEEELVRTDSDDHASERPVSAVESLKAKAETFKKSVGRSLRGGR